MNFSKQISPLLQAISKGLEEACKQFSTAIYEYFEKRACMALFKTMTKQVNESKNIATTTKPAKILSEKSKKSNDTSTCYEIRHTTNQVNDSEETLHVSFDYAKKIEQNYWKYVKHQPETLICCHHFPRILF